MLLKNGEQPAQQKIMPWQRVQAVRWTSAHKPRDAQGGHGGRSKFPLAPPCRGQPGSWNYCTQRVDLGHWVKCTQLCNPEGELRGLREAHTSRRDAKGLHKRLPSKFRPAAQGGIGDRSASNDPRDKQGTGGTAVMLREPFWSSCGNRCTYRESCNHCPKACWTHTHSKTCCWTLRCLSEREDPIPSTRTQAQALATRKASQATNPTAHSQGQTPQPRTMTLKTL